ncbi:hypothetical protein GpartN1_g345.t1 [Galdieria partita]|uniref:Thiamine phosphate synthase/TenI domain-containing protein n=1 Tax=Galdieria partita TaxID=83374 RepID=A0A9C7PQV9_9RHOD|nr:hypothetical protein GpartN1_g345.t1 [Galdieria partita]
MAFITWFWVKPRHTVQEEELNKRIVSKKINIFTSKASVELPNKSLIFITPNGCCQELNKLEETCTEAIIGGVSAIQLRDLASSVADFRKAARRLVKVVNYKCPLIINRDVQLALEIGASGVHFAEYQLNDITALELATQSQLLVGISVHSISSMWKAVDWSPSYIQVGSVFHTQSHPGQEPLGLSRLREIQTLIPSSIHLVAVGGIDLENVHKVKEEGISNIAVISAIAHNSNRIEYCRCLKKLLE